MSDIKSSIPKVGAAVKKSAANIAQNVGNPLTLGGIGLNLGLGVAARMASGDPFGSALMKEIPSSLLFGVAPALGWASMGLSVAGSLVGAVGSANKMLGLKYNQRHSSNPQFQYMDTNQAITMRQAAVQAIQGSKINGRNALGGEARMLHRAYSDRML